MRKRGTGSIERDGGKFRTRLVTDTGRHSLGVFHTREEADAVLEAARLELGELARSEGLTLEAWGATFLDRREREGYRSIADDRRRWRLHIASSDLAALPLRSIRSKDVRAWVDVLVVKRARDRRGRRRLSKRTLDNVLTLLRSALGAAMDRGLVETNAAEGVKVPKREAPTHEPWTYLLGEEQSALLGCKAIPARHRLILAFAMGAGLRQGEQFHLRLSDVHLAGPRPHVVVRRGSKDGGPKSTRGKVKIRRVPLFGIALVAMQGWLNLLPLLVRKNPLNLVFPGPTGAARQKGKHLHFTKRDPVTKKPKPFDPLPGYLAAAGIVPDARHDGRPVRWHDLRHTFGSSLVSGVWGPAWSLELLRVVMGHESIKTTERYAHLAESAIWAQAGRMMAPPEEPAESPRPSAALSLLGTRKPANQAEPPSRLELETYGLRTASSHEGSRGDGRLNARARALEALEALCRGEGELAASILDELAPTDADARIALEEAAAGRWSQAVDVIAVLAEEARTAELLKRTS